MSMTTPSPSEAPLPVKSDGGAPTPLWSCRPSSAGRPLPPTIADRFSAGSGYCLSS